MATLKTNPIMIRNVILSFPSLYQKSKFNGEETKYEATLLIPKTSGDLATVQKAIAELMAEAKWKAIPADKNCLKDGDTTLNSKGETRPEGKGRFILKGSNNYRPTCLSPNREELMVDDGTFYSGAIVNAKVSFWLQDNKFGRRVNCTLLAVQFVQDGERLDKAGHVDVSDFDVLAA